MAQRALGTASPCTSYRTATGLRFAKEILGKSLMRRGWVVQPHPCSMKEKTHGRKFEGNPYRVSKPRSSHLMPGDAQLQVESELCGWLFQVDTNRPWRLTHTCQCSWCTATLWPQSCVCVICAKQVFKSTLRYPSVSTEELKGHHKLNPEFKVVSLQTLLDPSILLLLWRGIEGENWSSN
jgi:hypothetical protein